MKAILFEKACRKKLRFKTRKGTLTLEDLLDFSLESLDLVGQRIITEQKNEAASLISTKTVESHLDLKLEIVKEIIREKQLKLQIVPKGTDEEIL